MRAVRAWAPFTYMQQGDMKRVIAFVSRCLRDAEKIIEIIAA